jgi:hypothetical protein
MPPTGAAESISESEPAPKSAQQPFRRKKKIIFFSFFNVRLHINQRVERFLIAFLSLGITSSHFRPRKRCWMPGR